MDKYIDLYWRDSGYCKETPKGCPYHYGYEKYAVPITTNGCIHKEISCRSCWNRGVIPFKIGDVVYADDGVVEGKGIVIENLLVADSYYMIIVFPRIRRALHTATESINTNGYKEGKFRYYRPSEIRLIPKGKIEDVMPLEEFVALLRLGYAQ